MHRHAPLVREIDDARHLLEREVVGPRTHAELVASQVHRIGAEAHGGAQLGPSARRRQQLRVYARIFTVDLGALGVSLIVKPSAAIPSRTASASAQSLRTGIGAGVEQRLTAASSASSPA